ncbi:hypothetical protein VP01_2721g1, partial [Puccinia sorghi]
MQKTHQLYGRLSQITTSPTPTKIKMPFTGTSLITFPYRKDITTFLNELDTKLSNLASVGLFIGDLKEAHIKESHAAETILEKLTKELLSLCNILLQSKNPLTIASVKEALDGKRSNNNNNFLLQYFGGFLTIGKASGMAAIKRVFSATINREGEACFLNSGTVERKNVS